MHCSDVWVELGHFFGALCVADQGADFPFRVRSTQCVQCIAAYEASSSCPVGVTDKNGVTPVWERHGTHMNIFGIVTVVKGNDIPPDVVLDVSERTCVQRALSGPSLI